MYKPVLFLIFNRPDTTQRVFEAIRKAKPPRLYIASDGARNNKEGEREIVNEVRQYVLNHVDWECDVKTLFREENLGCRNSVSGAISWFFKNEKDGIILEDDCLPNQSFFKFCEELLDYYKDDKRIMHISGNQFVPDFKEEVSYYFAKIQHCWGWASWADRWIYYGDDLKQYNDKNIAKFSKDYSVQMFWKDILEKMKKNQIDSWAYQWTFKIIEKNGLCINPSKNLISNIGFGEKATHTSNPDHAFANLPTYDIGNIVHPNVKIIHQDAVDYIYKHNFGVPFFDAEEIVKELDSVKKQLEVANSELFAVRKELEKIQISREWKLARLIARFCQILFPKNSLRRRMLKLIIRYLKFLNIFKVKAFFLKHSKGALLKAIALSVRVYMFFLTMLFLKKYNKTFVKRDKLKKILSINTIAGHGGAARAAYDMLAINFRKKGFSNKFLCSSSKITDDKDIYFIRTSNGLITKIFNLIGYLDLNHRSCKIKKLDIFKDADLVHLHNMHGGYFNPIFLPQLTAMKPTIWTLHDEQSITGHCAIPLDCQKWHREGCNQCPYLMSYPAIGIDNSGYLFDLKQRIYDESDITIVTPSMWLYDRVKKSILKDKDIRCIYNGIDEEIWRPYDKIKSRKELGLPLDKKILLFLSEGSIYNPSKGGNFIIDAMDHFKDDENVVFLVVGHEIDLERNNLISKGYIFDQNELAKYYSSADLFIFPSLSETFGFVTVEAMACGTPVISFDYSATSEIVQHMECGYLAKYKDSKDFINGIATFLNDDELRSHASISARRIFLEKFTLNKCLQGYQNLYQEIWNKNKENIKNK